MSTKVGIISEGPIDHVLIPPLLSHIARQDVGYKWPVESGDVAEVLPVRKRGHGGVLEAVRKVITFLKQEPLGYSLFVIVLDRRTRAVQEEIRRLIRGKPQFVLGIAIEEIEAWWLGDRTNTLAWTGFTHATLQSCRYGQCDPNGRLTYAAEKDDHPKQTLDELTVHSDALDSRYGEGNAQLAAAFAEDHWEPNAQLDEISTQCPNGFDTFRKEVRNALRAVRRNDGNLI